MQSIRDFFLFCSGSNSSILDRTPTEINKYAGIGATIFFTGVFAALAGGYAIYTVFQSYFAAVLFGSLWGLMIFNLDRYIVSTLKKKGRFFRDAFSSVPRIVLAVLIAVVIAKPLELKIFDSEIRAELVSMQQEKYKHQEDLLKLRYTDDIDDANAELVQLKQDLKVKENAVAELNLAAMAEADGSGGSLQRNMGPIYREKKKIAEAAELDLLAYKSNADLQISTKQEELASLKTKMQTDLEGLDKVVLNGFAARLEALDRLSKRSNIIFIASIFIMLLFIAIETAPIFVKLITQRSPYDFVLDKHEHSFEKNHELITSLLNSEVRSKLQFDQKTKDYKTELAINAEKEITKAALQERIDELKKQPFLWKELLSKGNSFFKV